MIRRGVEPFHPFFYSVPKKEKRTNDGEKVEWSPDVC